MSARDLLQECLKRAAFKLPAALAVRHGDVSLSYSELCAAIDSLTQKLPRLSGRRVLLLMPDGIPAYLVHLICFIERAILVPVSPQTPTARLSDICERIEPHLVVTTSLLRARHFAVLANLPTVTSQAEPTAFETTGPQLTGVRAENPHDLRLIVFTSGSTGRPKGVCLTARNILFAAQSNATLLGLNAARRSAVTVPLYDYYGFIQIYSHLLGQSGCVIGASVAFAEELLESILSTRATDLVLVPHTLRKLVAIAESAHGREAFAQLSYVTSSSDHLEAEIVRRMFSLNPHLTLFNIYGLTEAGRAAFQKIDATSDAAGAIGAPPPSVEIFLDASGEIVIHGPNVMAGYFSGIRSDLINIEPCCEMRTGDMARCDANGQIVLLGRRDALFNLKGAKIHATDIERVALQVNGVRDAIARTAVYDGEITIELDLLADGDMVDALVRERLRRSLPAAFVPRRVSCVREIVRTEIGAKLVRRNGGE